jgi:hypothetical protein
MSDKKYLSKCGAAYPTSSEYEFINPYYPLFYYPWCNYVLYAYWQPQTLFDSFVTDTKYHLNNSYTGYKNKSGPIASTSNNKSIPTSSTSKNKSGSTSSKEMKDTKGRGYFWEV